jgi:two-component sensor histidine kinase
MVKINSLRITEFLLIILVWIVLIAAPLLLNYNSYTNWLQTITPIEVILPLVITFIVNRFILVPNFLFKKRTTIYLAIVTLMIATVTATSYYYNDIIINITPSSQNEPNFMHMPHQEFSPSSIFGPPMGGQLGNDMARPNMPPFINVLIFSVLLVGFDTGLRTSYRFMEAEKEKSQLEVKNVQSQLAFLRNQVSPHFFMNTLNNIHSLIDIDTEEAKESVIQLSKLMRHLLYDSEIDHIDIEKELNFIANYVELMRLRCSNKVKINFNQPKHIPAKKIPPLLFTSYIENAFKHGISYREKSYIYITVLCTNEVFILEVENTNHAKVSDKKSSGIGIEN